MDRIGFIIEKDFTRDQKSKMHRSGFEPELLAWKAKVIATRPSVQVVRR
jgi:hypothetical protein